MSDEEAPSVKLNAGAVAQVEVNGTTEDTTDEIIDKALAALDETRERYHQIAEKERSGDDAPPLR
jgi:hypothetical protein